MAKRYHWIKIEEDFFRQREVKALRKLKNGDTCVIIYQKMLAYSLRYDNKIYFYNVEDTFIEEIALIIDEEVENVETTLAFLERVNLVEWVGEDELVFNQVNELTGAESDSAQRVRKHRAKKKEEKNSKKKEEDKNSNTTKKSKCSSKNITSNNDNVTDRNLCNENVTLDIEKEKEIEKELDKELETDTDKDPKESVGMCVDENLKQITKTYEQNIGPLYPANRQWFIEVSEKIQPALFEKAVEICIDKSNVTPSYLKGIIKRWMDQKIYTLEEYNAKEIELLNKNTKSKVKQLRRDFSSDKSKSQRWENEEIDENMLAEIKLLEENMGIS